MENADFRSGAIEIQWLETHLAEITKVPPPREGVVRAAIAAVLLAERERSAPRRATAATPSATTQDSSRESAWLVVARREALR
jgi:hypothetical protein